MTSAAARFPSRILCGVDLEGRSLHAVSAAAWLAQTLAVPLEYLHVFPPRPILWGEEARMPEWMAGTEVAASAALEAVRSALKHADPGLGLRTDPAAVSVQVRTGHPAQALLEHARTVHADLVVLGDHARRTPFDFGSTARGVLAHGNAVWAQSGHARPVRRILAAVDASPEAARVLATARDLARVFGARVTAVRAFAAPVLGAASPAALVPGPGYVVEHLRAREAEDFERELAAFDWGGVAHTKRFEDQDPARLVLEMQPDHDLVVMGTHGRTALSAALLGSVAQAVLRDARIPVLALRVPRQTYLI